MSCDRGVHWYFRGMEVLSKLTHCGIAASIKHGCTDIADPTLLNAIAGYAIARRREEVNRNSL